MQFAGNLYPNYSDSVVEVELIDNRYLKVDNINVVFEDGKPVGWYCPDGPFEEA